MKKSINLIASALVFSTFFALPVVSMAQDGSLDLTFGTNGFVTTPIGDSVVIGKGVAIQSDGKIVVAGYRDNGPFTDIALVRYNTNGSFDTTFDADGKVTTVIIGCDGSKSNAIALQSDGKIVVAGFTYAPPAFVLVRYNTNGSLDTNFDSDGIVTTSAIGTLNGAYAVAIQSDGRIVAAGRGSNSAIDIAAVRYNTNGSLDTTFDMDGIATTSIGAGNDFAETLAIQNDGKIVVGGEGVTGPGYDFALIRFNTNGSLDTTFDTDGIATTAIGTSSESGSAVVIQSDGKIVLAGKSFTGPSGYDFAIVRYNTNGSLDTTFDTDGKVTTLVGAFGSGGNAVVIQSDGKIVVVGYSNDNANHYSDIAMVRYNSNGSLDSTFDADGIVTTPIGLLSEGANSVVIQSDGKIVAAGSTQTGTNTAVLALARYNNTIPVGINETDNPTIEIKIYPNPFSSSITIQMDKILDNAILTIYNIYGQQVKQLNNLSGQTIPFHRDNLSDGVYFIQLTQENKIVMTSKLVIAD